VGTVSNKLQQVKRGNDARPTGVLHRARVGSDNTVVSAGGRHTVDDTTRNVVVHSLQIVLRYCHYPDI